MRRGSTSRPNKRLGRAFAEIGAGDEDDPIEAIGRLGARLILQQTLEEELTGFLGCERRLDCAPTTHRPRGRPDHGRATRTGSTSALT